MPTTTRRILIVRHGQSEWNRLGRWQGWEDIELTAKGEQQARVRAEMLAAVDHGLVASVASDLIRARRTAEILSEALGLAGPEIDHGFRERNGGKWQGHTRDEIEAKWPGELESWAHGHVTQPPGGESDAVVWARFTEALARQHERAPDGGLLVVTHGGVLRLAAANGGVGPHHLVPNVGGWWFEYDGATLVGGEILDDLPAITTESDSTE